MQPRELLIRQIYYFFETLSLNNFRAGPKSGDELDLLLVLINS